MLAELPPVIKPEGQRCAPISFQNQTSAIHMLCLAIPQSRIGEDAARKLYNPR